MSRWITQDWFLAGFDILLWVTCVALIWNIIHQLRTGVAWGKVERVTNPGGFWMCFCALALGFYITFFLAFFFMGVLRGDM